MNYSLLFVVLMQVHAAHSTWPGTEPVEFVITEEFRGELLVSLDAMRKELVAVNPKLMGQPIRVEKSVVWLRPVT